MPDDDSMSRSSIMQDTSRKFIVPKIICGNLEWENLEEEARAYDKN